MSQYLSMETLSWMLFDVFKVGELLSAPRFQDHDVASFRILLGSVKKFADAELVGFPFRITVGPRGVEAGTVEVVTREGLAAETMTTDEAVAVVADRVLAAR